MSSGIRCEVCGKQGHRRTGRLGPDGWFTGESRMSDEGSHDEGPEDPTQELIVVSVCSKECANNFWKPGETRMTDGYKKETTPG